MMKIYALNLPRCLERQESILSECARFGIEPELFSGIDGETLSDAELSQLTFNSDHNPLCKAEIGCTCAHLAVYRDILEKNISMAMILEDDSIFNIDPRAILDALERHPSDRADVYLLSHRSNRYIASGFRQTGSVRFYRGWNGVGGNGYVITKHAAANLCAFQTPIRYMCDDWKMFQFHGIIRFYVCDQEIIGLHPRLGLPAESLLERERLDGSDPKKKLYYRSLRQQAPIGIKAKYLLWKIMRWHSLKYQ